MHFSPKPNKPAFKEVIVTVVIENQEELDAVRALCFYDESVPEIVVNKFKEGYKIKNPAAMRTNLKKMILGIKEQLYDNI